MAKSAKKSQSIAFMSPWLIARFPKITKPDTEGKFADGKFKTDGLFEDDGDIAPTKETLLAAAQKFWPDVPVEDLRLPMKEFFDGRKDEEKTSAGMGLVLKSQYKPACFDAKKKKLPEGKAIGGGSVFRVASAIFPWSKTENETLVTVVEGKKVKETKAITAYGVGLRLGDVQVKQLVEHQGSGDGSAFDEVEGFEYEQGDDGSEQFGNDATDL